MKISKLACLTPPPFAPDEIEPGVFILRQVFHREQILADAASVLTAFILAIIIFGFTIQLIGLVWPNTTVPMLNLMIFALPYPLLIVGWLFWVLASFVRYFTEKSRTRVVRVQKQKNGSYDITINGHTLQGQLIACNIRIQRRRGIFARSKQLLAICVDAGDRVQLVVCTDAADELAEWQSRLQVYWVQRETALSVQGMI